MSDLTLSDQSTSGRSQAHGKAIWHCLILSAVTAAVWATGAFGDFVWIDHVEIEQAGYRVTNVEDLKQVWSRSLDSYLERESGQLAAELMKSKRIAVRKRARRIVVSKLRFKAENMVQKPNRNSQ